MLNAVFPNGNNILVGLGGTGGKILKAFKMRMFEEFPMQEDRDKLPVALLYVDSTDEMMPKDGKARPDFRVMGQDASFTQNEFLNIKAVDVDYILSHINNYPAIRRIVDNVESVRSAIGSLGQAAGQKRRAGRLLFAANAVGFVNSIRDAYARCEQISGDSSKLNVHIFAGLCGGTGSGAIVDVIVQTRKTFPNSYINVYAMIPEMNLPKADMDQGRYYQNGYAAVNELNALQSGRWFPQDVTGNGTAHLYNDRIKGVANGLTIYSNVNENGLTVNSLTELPKVVSDYIFARIFLINEEDEINSDIIRAYNFENMDDFALEYDETSNPDDKGCIPIARTKKICSFGVKRVMYPELRVLKHITYTVGESILYQFKYNNWRENQGFVNEERNKDYRAEYLNKDNLIKWKLDVSHLTLEEKILETDTDYPKFNEYWHSKAMLYSEEANKADCPLNELDRIMNEFYERFFREDGVVAYFSGKEHAIPEMAKEVRHKIEDELFKSWHLGDVSIVELQKVSKLLLERMSGIRKELDERFKEENENYKECDEARVNNVQEWSRLSLGKRIVGFGSRRYGDHQNILIDYYTSKTMCVAIDFAKKLAAKIFIELGKMDVDISMFGQKINEAIEETERLITAQRKVNKGLEDMKGAIVEVSEDEAMQEFEVDVKIDKVDMPNIARQLRDAILPQSDFLNFGNLANNISVEEIKDAFDVKLSKIVKTKHDEKADSDNKVLGLNILTQLRQKLKTDDDIKAFASKIVSQSGVYLILNNDQLQLHLRNNEGNLSPINPASINKKTILVSIPSPDDNISLKSFADKLETAFKNSFNQSTARTTIVVNRKSTRKDELSIITVSYCFPMRAIDWIKPFKQRYENFLNTGNVVTDEANAILLHSEGLGRQFPSLFVVDNAEEIAAKAAKEAQEKKLHSVSMQQLDSVYSQINSGVVMPPTIPGGAIMPPVPPVEPEIKVMLYVGGQQYGPFNRDMCTQMVKTGQLTAHTLVWMEGMVTWLPAGQVPLLSCLFVPIVPPIPTENDGMPPIM